MDSSGIEPESHRRERCVLPLYYKPISTLPKWTCRESNSNLTNAIRA